MIPLGAFCIPVEHYPLLPWSILEREGGQAVKSVQELGAGSWEWRKRTSSNRTKVEELVHLGVSNHRNLGGLYAVVHDLPGLIVSSRTATLHMNPCSSCIPFLHYGSRRFVSSMGNPVKPMSMAGAVKMAEHGDECLIRFLLRSFPLRQRRDVHNSARSSVFSFACRNQLKSQGF